MKRDERGKSKKGKHLTMKNATANPIAAMATIPAAMPPTTAPVLSPVEGGLVEFKLVLLALGEEEVVEMLLVVVTRTSVGLPVVRTVVADDDVELEVEVEVVEVEVDDEEVLDEVDSEVAEVLVEVLVVAVVLERAVVGGTVMRFSKGSEREKLGIECKLIMFRARQLRNTL